LNKFFYGSTAPFGDSSRQPDQFRFRAQWRTISVSGPLLLFSAHYTLRQHAASPIFISGGGRPRSHVISFRSTAFKPWSEMTFGAENAHQAASGNTIEEVKPAA